MSLYENLSLAEDGLIVRILEVLPGMWTERVNCRLVVKQIMGTTHYEALSYTWGLLTDRVPITVNGVETEVTSNLECALRHLRKKRHRRRLWVDAVCINQLDLQERADQVMKTGQIYRHADQVLVWLGLGNEYTDAALRYARWFSRSSKGNFEFAAVRCCPHHSSRRYGSYETVIIGFTCETCNRICFCDTCHQKRRDISFGMDDLLARDWWRRIWVVQEVAMAAGDPILGCGKSWAPWTDVVQLEAAGSLWSSPRMAIAHIQSIRHDIKNPPRLRDMAGPIPYSSEAATADDVFHWLRRTAGFRATDARDKVYALLGMARNRRWREFRPDYTISPRELVFNLVSQMILSDQNLDILMLCRPDHSLSAVQGPAPNSLRSSRMASWVPDFQVDGLPYLATMDHLAQESPLRSLMQELSTADVENVTICGMTSFADLRQRSILNIESRRPDEGLHKLSSKCLRVPGNRIDVVRSRPCNDLSTDLMQNTGVSHLSQIQIHGQECAALYYWSSVWCALDPVHLKMSDDTNITSFLNNLRRYLELLPTLEAKGKQLQKASAQLDQELIASMGTSLPHPDQWPLMFRYRRAENTYLEEAIDQLVEEIETLKQRLDTGRWLTAIQNAIDGRGYFITSGGLLGIGPKEVQEGDVIVMLKNSSAAYALREQDQSHVLIGNVFVNLPHAPLWSTKALPESATWQIGDARQDIFEMR